MQAGSERVRELGSWPVTTVVASPRSVRDASRRPARPMRLDFYPVLNLSKHPDHSVTGYSRSIY